eukprot:gb/GEZJ01001882.1/.p1 GENE.gb/GEZJ01001882.1/~~gb/GEZJ01001882.1/.p1  ORF type:complete len:396 (+),score=37.89 gb/GEZJ01001882.1/:1842-3029(+)
MNSISRFLRVKTAFVCSLPSSLLFSSPSRDSIPLHLQNSLQAKEKKPIMDTSEQQSSLDNRPAFLCPLVLKNTHGCRQCFGTPQLCDRTPTVRSSRFMMSTTSTTTPTRLYFGYASNMSRKKMQKRTAGAEFANVLVGRLEDWQLCMNIVGNPPAEPAFGNIRPCIGDEVFGVVYNIKTESDWKKLMRSEGVGGHSKKLVYQIVEVSVECFSPETPSERTVRSVFTLMSPPAVTFSRQLETHVFPSARYMDIVLSGAKEERLPRSYINRLERIPVARTWNGTLLQEMNIFTAVLSFFLTSKGMGRVLLPFRVSYIYSYALHEKFARRDGRALYERMMMLLSKIAMFCAYIFPNIGAFFLLLVRGQTRDTYRKIREVVNSQKISRSPVDAKDSKNS